ncbi:MAG: hypothetical protein IT353_03320 [Gemmatimonadaceae bacterium]|nr:hypothetical protein [Gemmatimonadaceae bacterium]
MKRIACGALVLLAAPAWAQRTVTESSSAYRAARRLTLVESARWCRDPEAPGCDYKGISEVVATPDGGVVAADYRGPMRRFTATGTFTKELSRKGAGPGEYRYVTALQLAKDSILEWYDPILRRVTRASLATGQAGPVSAMTPPPRLDGAYLVDGSLVVFEIPTAAKPGDTVDARFRRVSDGTPSRVLATVRHPSRYHTDTTLPLPPPLFAPNTVADVGWNGDVAHSTARRFEVSVFPSGGAPWRVRVAVAPRPVLPSERDSAIAEELTSSDARNIAELSPVTRDRIANALTEFPQIETLRVLRDGTIWMRPTAPRSARTARWDVFSRSGARIGFAELPLSAVIKDGTANWIVATILQANDVPGIVRYTVVR